MRRCRHQAARQSPPHWALRALGVLAVAYFARRRRSWTSRRASSASSPTSPCCALARRAGAEPAHRVHRPDLDRPLGVLRRRRVHAGDPREGPRVEPRLDLPGRRPVCFVVGVLVGVPALRLKGLTWRSSPSPWPSSSRRSSSGASSTAHDGARHRQLRYEDVPALADASASSGAGRSRASCSTGSRSACSARLRRLRGLVKSRVGRSLVAVRDNATAAAVMGVNVRDEDARVRHVRRARAPRRAALALRPAQSPRTTLLHDPRLDRVPGDHGHRRRRHARGPIVGAFAYYRLDDVTRDCRAER